MVGEVIEAGQAAGRRPPPDTRRDDCLGDRSRFPESELPRSNLTSASLLRCEHGRRSRDDRTLIRRRRSRTQWTFLLGCRACGGRYFDATIAKRVQQRSPSLVIRTAVSRAPTSGSPCQIVRGPWAAALRAKPTNLTLAAVTRTRNARHRGPASSGWRRWPARAAPRSEKAYINPTTPRPASHTTLLIAAGRLTKSFDRSRKSL